MAERRWGRVTVEGWIEQTPGWVKVWTGTTSCVGPLASTFGEGGPVSVEFLPEPVTFKDGDVVQYRRDREVLVRRAGLWWGGDESGGSDRAIAADLRDGFAVRLVPEANGG